MTTDLQLVSSTPRPPLPRDVFDVYVRALADALIADFQQNPPQGFVRVPCESVSTASGRRHENTEDAA